MDQNQQQSNSQWAPHSHQNDIFINTLTHDQIQRHQITLKQTNNMEQQWNKRMKTKLLYVCQLVYYRSQQPGEINKDQKYRSTDKVNQKIKQTNQLSYYVYTDRMLPITAWTIEILIMVLKGIQKLISIYGLFMPTPMMLCQNEKGQVKVWINKNPILSSIERQVINEQRMIIELIKIIGRSNKKLSQQLQKIKTILECLNNLEQRKILIKNQKIIINNNNSNNSNKSFPYHSNNNNILQKNINEQIKNNKYNQNKIYYKSPLNKQYQKNIPQNKDIINNQKNNNYIKFDQLSDTNLKNQKHLQMKIHYNRINKQDDNNINQQNIATITSPKYITQSRSPPNTNKNIIHNNNPNNSNNNNNSFNSTKNNHSNCNNLTTTKSPPRKDSCYTIKSAKVNPKLQDNPSNSYQNTNKYININSSQIITTDSTKLKNQSYQHFKRNKEQIRIKNNKIQRIEQKIYHNTNKNIDNQQKINNFDSNKVSNNLCYLQTSGDNKKNDKIKEVPFFIQNRSKQNIKNIPYQNYEEQKILNVLPTIFEDHRSKTQCFHAINQHCLGGSGCLQNNNNNLTTSNANTNNNYGNTTINSLQLRGIISNDGSGGGDSFGSMSSGNLSSQLILTKKQSVPSDGEIKMFRRSKQQSYCNNLESKNNQVKDCSSQKKYHQKQVYTQNVHTNQNNLHKNKNLNTQSSSNDMNWYQFQSRTKTHQFHPHKLNIGTTNHSLVTNSNQAKSISRNNQRQSEQSVQERLKHKKQLAQQLKNQFGLLLQSPKQCKTSQFKNTCQSSDNVQLLQTKHINEVKNKTHEELANIIVEIQHCDGLNYHYNNEKLIKAKVNKKKQDFADLKQQAKKILANF